MQLHGCSRQKLHARPSGRIFSARIFANSEMLLFRTLWIPVSNEGKTRESQNEGSFRKYNSRVGTFWTKFSISGNKSLTRAVDGTNGQFDKSRPAAGAASSLQTLTSTDFLSAYIGLKSSTGLRGSAKVLLAKFSLHNDDHGF